MRSCKVGAKQSALVSYIPRALHYGARVYADIAVDLEGNSEVVVREPSIPLCFDFLPDGCMVIMSGRRVLRLEPDGSLAIPKAVRPFMRGRERVEVGEFSL